MSTKERTRSLRVEGKMTDEDTATVMKIHAWGEILNNALWRIALLIGFYRSPDFAEVIAQWWTK